MTVDELNEFMYNHGFCNTNNNEDLPKIYVSDVVEDALKDGYIKAIDDFAEKIKLEISESIIWSMLVDSDKDNSFGDTSDKIVDYVIEEITKVAEQLKEGSADNE